MRDYQASYSATSGEWSVIARDPEDEYWWTYLPDCGNKVTALKVARALREFPYGETEA